MLLCKVDVHSLSDSRQGWSPRHILVATFLHGRSKSLSHGTVDCAGLVRVLEGQFRRGSGSDADCVGVAFDVCLFNEVSLTLTLLNVQGDIVMVCSRQVLGSCLDAMAWLTSRSTNMTALQYQCHIGSLGSRGSQ